MSRLVSAFGPKLRDIIFDRADNRCERCGAPILRSRGDYSIQHRRNRGMGGSRRQVNPALGVLLCGSATTRCHGYIEANPPSQSMRECESLKARTR